MYNSTNAVPETEINSTRHRGFSPKLRLFSSFFFCFLHIDGVENFDDKFIFPASPLGLQIIRFIKSALFTQGSRRVIYWSGLFTNTTAGGGRGVVGEEGACYEDYEVNCALSFLHSRLYGCAFLRSSRHSFNQLQ